MRMPADRRIAAGLVALVLLAGCGSGEPGVGVANLQSDVVYGADIPDPVGPANFNPPPVTEAQGGADLDLPDQTFNRPLRPIETRTPPAAPRRECPAAALNAFPDETAPLQVPLDPPRLPAEGTYRWQKSGELQGVETAGMVIEVSGFEQRRVQELTVVSESVNDDDETTAITFTFQTVQPDVSGNLIVVTTFQVRTDGQQSAVRSPATPHEVRTGEPERGLAIKRIQRFDRQGNLVSEFAPVSGLLLLALPVLPGEQFQAAAVDPRTRESMQIQGQVQQRDRVDACGQIIEGWRVETVLTSSGPAGSFSREYNYIVAPQLGGLLLREELRETGASSFDLTFTIGQQHPDETEVAP